MLSKSFNEGEQVLVKSGNTSEWVLGNYVYRTDAKYIVDINFHGFTSRQVIERDDYIIPYKSNEHYLGSNKSIQLDAKEGDIVLAKNHDKGNWTKGILSSKNDSTHTATITFNKGGFEFTVDLPYECVKICSEYESEILEEKKRVYNNELCEEYKFCGNIRNNYPGSGNWWNSSH